VLNITFAARLHHIDVSPIVTATDAPSTSGSSGSLQFSSSPEDDASDDVITPQFTIREDDDEDTTSTMRSSAHNLQQQRSIQRNKKFQHELLSVSAELLFLSSDHAKVFLPNLDIVCTDKNKASELLLQPFLESSSSYDESFKCIALLLFRFLLLSGKEKKDTKSKDTTTMQKRDQSSKDTDIQSVSELDKMSIVGYDARVRYAFKYLAVSIFSYWELKQHSDFMTPQTASAYATCKFEALEESIALRLSILSKQMRNEEEKKLSGQKKQQSLSQNAIRGLKIGAAGVAAGTVFAITGGLATPAIIGGLAALTGASSAVVVVASILLLPAATTIFGVGGGTLVASKMSKRTAGLTEFDIVKVTSGENGDGKNKKTMVNIPELSRTLCASGWLKDIHDFERPFGTTPRNLTDPLELLCRFCSVYQPDVIPECSSILLEWSTKEKELWEMCKASYGKDPSELLPLKATGPRYVVQLSDTETKAVDELIVMMGLPLSKDYAELLSSGKEPHTMKGNAPPTVNLLSDVLVSNNDGGKPKKEMSDLLLRSYKVWDFTSEYASELYVVEWESKLLLELQGSAKELQKQIIKKAAEEALKKTALATLMAAVFLPSILVSLSNMIDEKWTLANERADEAGILLAQSLLQSDAGHRPVSLIGFSFGARMIISCLKEIARCQVLWEQQEAKDEVGGVVQTKMASFRKSLSSMPVKRNETQKMVFTREPASIIEKRCCFCKQENMGKCSEGSCWSCHQLLFDKRYDTGTDVQS